MQNLSIDFLNYLQVKSQNIPDRILEKAKDCLCDYLAVTEAGAVENAERWDNFCSHVPSGKVSIIGMKVMTDGKTACLVNGYNAHSLELDDGHRFGMLHLGAAIITALYSAMMENDIIQEKVLRGIVMGYEAACRLAVAIQPSHKKKGFHTAGTCGTIGAAIGIAFALDMNMERMQTILATAVASAAGMLEIQEQSSELKPYNLGRAAMDGFAAAYMGFTDFVGPDDMLDGERGFLQLFSNDSMSSKVTEKQEYFEIDRIYVKPYAACRHCHSAIEAALMLRKTINMDEIEKISVETYRLAVKGHDHTEIYGTSSAKLSIPYSVAVAFLLGRGDVVAFDLENVKRQDILQLTKKVVVKENEEFSLYSPQKRIAKVIVQLKDKTIKEWKVDYAKGEPENPMSREEIKKKAEELLGKDGAARLIQKVYIDSV